MNKKYFFVNKPKKKLIYCAYHNNYLHGMALKLLKNTNKKIGTKAFFGRCKNWTDVHVRYIHSYSFEFSPSLSLSVVGDSMMYQHTVNGIGCSGNSPTSTPPNINACSSSTPPLANSNHQNNNSSHENNSDQLVCMVVLLCIIYNLHEVYEIERERKREGASEREKGGGEEK